MKRRFVLEGWEVLAIYSLGVGVGAIVGWTMRWAKEKPSC